MLSVAQLVGPKSIKVGTSGPSGLIFTQKPQATSHNPHKLFDLQCFLRAFNFAYDHASYG
jgi:hypothetical protein